MNAGGSRGHAPCAVLLALVPCVALAHTPSDSFLLLEQQSDGIAGRWDIALKDLEGPLGLDADGDGRITWGEVRAQQAEVTRYALSRLALRADGRPCTPEAGELQVARRADAVYAALSFAAGCAPGARVLEADYGLLFDEDAQHRGIVRVGPESFVLSAERHTLRTDLEAPSAWRQFGAMVLSGMTHIWEGYDHLLFLLALLLPSVLTRGRDGRWYPQPALPPALRDVVRTVSAFTVAHSVTLTVSALGVLTLPSRLVEAAIAASVVLAALNNLFPVVRHARWGAALILGLLHGFGFAAVLGDVGLPREGLVAALLGFNLGVELGQLACVLVYMPFAYALRASAFYRRGLLLGGSAAIAFLACIWLVERALGIALLPT